MLYCDNFLAQIPEQICQEKTAKSCSSLVMDIVTTCEAFVCSYENLTLFKVSAFGFETRINRISSLINIAWSMMLWVIMCMAQSQRINIVNICYNVLFRSCQLVTTFKANIHFCGYEQSRDFFAMYSNRVRIPNQERRFCHVIGNSFRYVYLHHK